MWTIGGFFGARRVQVPDGKMKAATSPASFLWGVDMSWGIAIPLLLYYIYIGGCLTLHVPPEVEGIL
jgi:hypothetical protein